MFKRKMIQTSVEPAEGKSFSSTGAIIGDGDRNEIPFSVVALAPEVGPSKKTNVLF